jgi:hypothetical protein
VRGLVTQLSELGWLLARAAWLGASGLAQVVAWLLRLIAVSMGDAPRESARNGSGLSDLPFGLGARHAPLARTDWDALPLVLGFGMLLTAALFLRFWLAARVRERAGELLEDSASTLSFRGVLERWRGRLGAARALLSRGRGELRSLFQPSRQPQDVRALYRQLLRWAAAHGHARRGGVTAWELAHELGEAYPDRRSELQALTAHYQAVRYGAHTASEAELARARELLAAVLREPPTDAR